MDIKKIVTFSFSGLAAAVLIFICIHYNVAPNHTPALSTVSCSDGKPAHTLIKDSSDPLLKKLAEYEALCRGEVTNTMMVFTAMPTSEDEAATLAQNIAGKLKLLADNGITPLVAFEPSLTLPTIINDIRDGMYDSILSTYFQQLKSAGISEQQMGTWTLFPEANTPTWHNTDPSTFAQNVTKVAKLLKTSFPKAKTTILLNSHTYPGNDAGWDHGEIKDLTSYVTSIPPNILDSFGYQGFPSVAAANASNQYSSLDAKDFLPSNIAKSAAKKLGTKNIWLNTGSFQRIYTDDPAESITTTPEQRQQTLTSIVTQAKALQADYTVSVNLFAKDKSTESEHVNWSYWQTGKYSTDPHADALKTFLEQLHERNIELSLYDSM